MSLCPHCHRDLGPASEPSQLDLSSLAVGPKARAQDPATAKNAALLNAPRRGSQRERILRAVVKAGANGATYTELAGILSLPGVSVSTRISELVRGDWLIPTSHTRPTDNGGDAAVLIASHRALDLFNENAPAERELSGADQRS